MRIPKSVPALVYLVAVIVSANAMQDMDIDSRFDGSGSLALRSSRSTKAKARPLTGQTRLPKRERAVQPKYRPPALRLRAPLLIPATFDARTKWPNCTSIRHVRNQSPCQNCWAVAATSALSDRICIASGQENDVFISANQATACVYPKKTDLQSCFDGGNEMRVYRWAAIHGLPTGGEQDMSPGCVPYPAERSVTCKNACTNPHYSRPIEQDKYLIDGYYLETPKYVTENATENATENTTENVNEAPTMNAAQIRAAVRQMQTDIITRGPLTATFTVYDDFMGWTPEQGPYKGPQPNTNVSGAHLVKVIGWNKDKNDVPYWVLSNSWGTEYGDKGIFWMQMGNNTCGIESYISAPIVTIPSSCSRSTFCTMPIDQAISFENPHYPTAPSYLFQGACVQEFTVSAGKIKTVGQSEPFSKVFLTGFPGPIVNYDSTVNGTMYLANAAGQFSLCDYHPQSKKFSCDTLTPIDPTVYQDVTDPIDSAYYENGSMVVWSYSSKQPGYLTRLNDTDNNPISLGMLFSTDFASVSAIRNLDNTKMLIAGKDADGSPISGILAISLETTGYTFKWATPPGPTWQFNSIDCSEED